MTHAGTAVPPAAESDFFRADTLIRWQRRLGIAPQEGLGVVRRAVFFALLGWLPIVIWAVLNQRLLAAPNGEPLLSHFGIHVRCLVATPLLILAEAMAFKLMNGFVAEFRHSGVVSEAETPAFTAVLQGMARLRDAQLPWVVLLGLAVAWTLGSPLHADSDEMAWAADAGGFEGFGFGGLWFLYVARPIFVVLMLSWLWRIALVVFLFWRLSRLNLSLVPTHPDRCGGLGFLMKLPSAYFLVTLALSAVLASRWMHDLLYHGHILLSYKAPFILFVLLWGGVMLAPLLLFAPQLAALKRQGLRDYGALIGGHGRLVHQRWILGQTLQEPAEVLDAPELGPVADTAAIYQAVEQIRPAPIAASSVAMIVIPCLLPMLFVIAAQMPLRELLLKLLKTVI
jgi:hypothetical protein